MSPNNAGSQEAQILSWQNCAPNFFRGIVSNLATSKSGRIEVCNLGPPKQYYQRQDHVL
jgi:hypothetical protein